MKFSILITSYNKDQYIEETISSCLNQTEKDYEIILYDNHSTDETNSLIEKYSEKISINKRQKKSEFAAINQIDLLTKAFQKSSGDIICLLDGDDLFFKNKLHEIKNIFLNNKEIDVVFDIPIIKEGTIEKEFIIKKKLFKYIWPTIIPTSGISLKREFMEKCVKNYLVDDFKFLEIDLKLNIVSQNIKKNFKFCDKKITIYRSQVKNSIMTKNKKFYPSWWAKRSEAHDYMEKMYLVNRIKYKKGLDYYLTNTINKIMN
jgi:glycosyltransferase involved in cell wall biosynthesis